MILFIYFWNVFVTCYGVVPSPPYWVKQVPAGELIFTVLPGQDQFLILPCEADGSPAPRYSWTKNDSPFDWRSRNERISQKPGEGTLLISLPDRSDEGYYQCFAMNEKGISSSNVVKVVMSNMNAFPDDPVIKAVAETNQPFSLKCLLPAGYPKPKVFWMIQHLDFTFCSLKDRRLTVDPEGTLWFSYVEPGDFMGQSMYRCGAFQESGHEIKLGYRFILNVTDAKPNKDIEDKALQIQIQYTTRKGVIAVRGETTHLWCIFGGKPIPKVTWKKNGGDIKENKYGFLNENRTLVIYKTAFTDEGSYECTGTNGLTTPQSFRINVFVRSKPFFIKEPVNINTIEGQSVEYECIADGSPAPTITWFHNGKPITESRTNERRNISTTSIKITAIHKNDTGTYACNASNALGYVFRTAHLNVLVDVAPEIPDQKTAFDVVEGHSVQIECKAIGAPKPTINWYRGVTQVSGPEYKVTPEGFLRIRNSSRSDAGEYSCVASNPYGAADKRMYLFVKNRTSFRKYPMDVDVGVGSEAIFTCSVSADPSLNVRLYWRFEHMILSVVEEDSIQFNNSQPKYRLRDINTLIVLNVTEADEGRYSCIAESGLDRIEATAYLKVVDVPDSPILLSATCHNRQAVVTWRPAKTKSELPVLRYLIQYSTEFNPGVWETHLYNISPDETVAKIELSPWANYSFRVLAFNKVGLSLPSDASTNLCQSPGDNPYKNPDNLRGKGTHPHNMVISWMIMPMIDHNGPNLHYIIYWKRDLATANWTRVLIPNWQDYSYSLEHQPTFEKYRIKITAKNIYGLANTPPTEVIGYSGEDVPLAAPENFKILKVIDGRGVIFGWDHIDPESVRGHFKGYKVQGWSEGSDPSKSVEMIFENTVNKALVDIFKPNSINYAQVLVFNELYNGPPSNIIMFKTMEGRPGPVERFYATTITATSITVNWEPPKEPNGVIKGYNVTFAVMNGWSVEPSKKYQPFLIDPSERKLVMLGLKPNTQYRITITAVTTVGEGSMYYIEVSTKKAQ